MRIKAAILRAAGQPFVIDEIDLDEPRANEVVVRVVSSGICHTDLATRDGDYKVPMPCVLGHEGAGIVEQVGSNCTTVQPGDHVVIGFNTCGKCPACLLRTPYCEDVMRIRLGLDRPDGSPTMRKGQDAVHGNFFGQSSFATHALCEEASLVGVRRDVPLDVLGPFACSVETGAGAIFTSLRCAPGSSLAVFGAGAVGMCAVMAARVAGCTTIIAVDMKDNRLRVAQELGATHIINAAVTDPVQEIQRITKGGVNYSFESTGVTKVIRQAVDALRPLGVCGMVGQVPPGEEVSLDPWTILLGRTLRGIIQGDAIPQILIPQIVELYLQGRFPIDRLIKYYSLEKINKAAADSEQGAVIKAVLRPNESSGAS
jgi:aryl-alcohol dehydrogenase